MNLLYYFVMQSLYLCIQKVTLIVNCSLGNYFNIC